MHRCGNNIEFLKGNIVDDMLALITIGVYIIIYNKQWLGAIMYTIVQLMIYIFCKVRTQFLLEAYLGD